jgi:hypothetical protein
VKLRGAVRRDPVVSEEHIASIFRVEDEANRETYRITHKPDLAENGGDLFLRYVGKIIDFLGTPSACFFI